jgi:hypothetical protein
MTPAAERYGELREDFEAGVRGGTTGEGDEAKE